MRTKQMIEVFNKKVAGVWDLPSGVCPYFKTKDGQKFVGGYYFIPKVSRKKLVNGWITVRGEVKMKNEETGEWITLPAVFEFQWNGEEWKLDSWNFSRKKDRGKYSPVF